MMKPGCNLLYELFDKLQESEVLQGPVVQSVVNLTSSLMVKMLTVLVSTISNSQVFLLKKVSSKCKATHIFFSKHISAFAISNDQSFNDTLTNDTVSFEKLGPNVYANDKSICC